MKWSCRRRVHYWFLDYGEIAFVLSILIAAFILIIWMLVLLLTPKTAIAGDIVNFRTATRQASATLHSDRVVSRDSVPVVTILCEVTAYSPTRSECDAAPLVTASGQKVRVGGIAADLDVLPFGSIVLIPGYNGGKPCQVVDTGGAIRGNKLDVFMRTAHEAIHWGRRRNVRVTVLYRPKARP